MDLCKFWQSRLKVDESARDRRRPDRRCRFQFSKQFLCQMSDDFFTPTVVCRKPPSLHHVRRVLQVLAARWNLDGKSSKDKSTDSLDLWLQPVQRFGRFARNSGYRISFEQDMAGLSNPQRAASAGPREPSSSNWAPETVAVLAEQANISAVPQVRQSDSRTYSFKTSSHRQSRQLPRSSTQTWPACVGYQADHL